MTLRLGHQRVAVGHSGRQGLFQKHMLIRLKNGSHHGMVGVVGGGNHHRINVVPGEKIIVVLVAVRAEPVCAGLPGFLTGTLVGIGDGDHVHRIDLGEVSDVLAAHHSCADDPKARRHCVSPKTRSPSTLNRGAAYCHQGEDFKPMKGEGC